MSSNVALPIIEAAVAVISLWQFANGLRTGTMNFGFSTVSVSCNRENDPSGFWVCGFLNAMTAGLMIWLLIYPR